MSAASVPLEAYAALFTSSFDGYRYPVAMDAERMARRVRQEQHDLRRSLVAYAGERAVGVAALAIRGEAGWVGGFGVVPEERGRGRGRELMSALLKEARACGLRTLSLEVLSHNEAARRLYERAGMHVARDLLILERTAKGVGTTDGRDIASESASAEKLSASDTTSQGLPASLEEAAPGELLAHFARLHRVAPAWQRDLPSLLVKGSLRGLRLTGDRDTRAYALVAREPDDTTYLVDLAADAPQDAQQLSAALAELAGPLKIVNEPEQSLFAAPLTAHGFAETDRQHEMRLAL
ncbi:MAG TPA: GNAT family N-acetyltransferase [Pyrinomonadaceae bacterium]|nr:GNAT family N-acetyltransferase [Pyrinomonadaceae bacterium]